MEQPETILACPAAVQSGAEITNMVCCGLNYTLTKSEEDFVMATATEAIQRALDRAGGGGAVNENRGERLAPASGWPEGCRKLRTLIEQAESEVREIKRAAYKAKDDGWYDCMIEVICALEKMKLSIEEAAALPANKQI